MTVFETYHQYRYLFDIESMIKDHDLTVCVSTDFDEYKEYRSHQEGRAKIPSMFDSECSFVNGDSAFWIKCTNASGKIVYTQAIRMMDLSDVSLVTHLNRAKLIYAPPELQHTSAKTLKLSAPNITSAISGKVTYHGEAWSDTSIRNYKRGELSLMFGRYGLACALLFWPVHYCFAFTSYFNGLRGFTVRSGFLHLDHITWRNEETCQEHNEWFMWMHADDVQRMMQLHPEKLSMRKAS